MSIVLFGRGETKKTNPYDQKSLLTIVDAVKGNLKFSPLAVTALGIGDQYIGLAQDEIKVNKVGFGGSPITSEKVFYIHTSDEKNGFKVAKNGAANSRYYARELAKFFAEGRLSNIVLEVATTPTVISAYPEIKFFKVSDSMIDEVEESTKQEVSESVIEGMAEVETPKESSIIESMVSETEGLDIDLTIQANTSEHPIL